MVSIIKSVSMTQSESDFINDYNLSPSQLLKEKIWEMKGMITSIVSNKIEKFQNIIIKQSQDIERLELLLKNKDVLEKKEQ